MFASLFIYSTPHPLTPSTTMKIKTNLKIIEWNCNSLISKLELIKQFIRANKPDILLLNETKCSKEMANFNVQINGYDFLINPRKVNPNFCGGVAMFINKKLSYSQVNEFNSFDEFLAIKTKIKNNVLLISTLYKPPSSSLPKELFEKISVKFKYFIIGGDLNSKLIEFGNRENNADGQVLNQILESHDCSIVNDKSATYFEPRHNQEMYSEILDLFICSNNLVSNVNYFSAHTNADVIVDIKYHCPIEIKINSNFSQNEIQSESKFNFDKANWPTFQNHLTKIHIETDHLNEENLNNLICKHIHDATQLSIPFVKLSKFIFTLPPDIREKIKEKNKMRREVSKKKNINNTALKTEFNKIVQDLKLKIYSHRVKQWQDFIEKVGPNPSSSRPFWQRINRARTNKSTQSNIPNLFHENKIFELDKEKADLFKSILEKTFSQEIDENFTDKEFYDQVNANVNSNEYINEYRHSNNEYKEISIAEIKLAIQACKKHSTCGFDGIHNQMIKHLPENFIEYIKILFYKNLSNSSMC